MSTLYIPASRESGVKAFIKRYPLLYISGFLFTVPWLMFAGALLLAHSSLDRVFGYGLIYEDAFQNTHLGSLGRLIMNKTS